MSSRLSKPYYLEYSDAFDRRQLRDRDRQRQERQERIINLMIALGIVLFIVIVLIAAISEAYGRPIKERTAYLEGYYNIDHATAVAWARQGLGKTSEEVLAKGVR